MYVGLLVLSDLLILMNIENLIGGKEHEEII